MKKGQSTLERREFLRLISTISLGVLASCVPNQKRTPRPTQGSSFGQAAPAKPETAATLMKPSTNNPTANPISQAQSNPTDHAYLGVAHGTDATAVTQTVLATLGGMERFVKPGADVIIKPNICTEYYPYEYAATTNPQVIAALVTLCLGAGAKQVRVMDHPFGGRAESAYVRSGISEAVTAAGGKMEMMNENKYQKTAIPQGRDIKEWMVYKDILTADVVINVPIAKDHGTTRLTLGAKNLLGVIQNANRMHANIHQRIADLTSLIKPTLTVIDAMRILTANGPTGGNLDDVKMTNTIIASQDIVAADAYAATLFGLTAADIGYIQIGAEMGLGNLDLQSLKIEEVNV